MIQTAPEISIIVPVYNVEKYLRQCLDSIKSQTFQDWECILIDDGSKDNSGAICDEYQEHDSRFRVIHRDNGGVSAARNDGLIVSQGRYISFVDPDDVVHCHMLERLRILITAHKADVAQVGYELLFTSFSKKKPLVESLVELDRGDVAKELLNGSRLPCYLWNKLFKREVIDTPFPEGMVFEDMYVMSQWVSNVKKMILSPEILYSYRQRSGSIVNSNYATNLLEHLKSVFRLVYSMRTLEPMNVSSVIAEKCIWKGVIGTAKNIARFVDNDDACMEALTNINMLCRNLSMPKIETVGLKTRYRISLLRNHPEMFVRIMRLVYSLECHKYRRRKGQFNF